MSDERAIRPHDDHALATTGQPSRWVARGLHHLDRPRRRLIDLGTLGGGSSRVHAINNRGQVVGRNNGDGEGLTLYGDDV